MQPCRAQLRSGAGRRLGQRRRAPAGGRHRRSTSSWAGRGRASAPTAIGRIVGAQPFGVEKPKQMPQRRQLARLRGRSKAAGRRDRPDRPRSTCGVGTGRSTVCIARRRRIVEVAARRRRACFSRRHARPPSCREKARQAVCRGLPRAARRPPHRFSNRSGGKGRSISRIFGADEIDHANIRAIDRRPPITATTVRKRNRLGMQGSDVEAEQTESGSSRTMTMFAPWLAKVSGKAPGRGRYR